MIGYFNLVNNLNNFVNYCFIIIIVPEKPLWGGSIKYECMYVLLHNIPISCSKVAQISKSCYQNLEKLLAFLFVCCHLNIFIKYSYNH